MGTVSSRARRSSAGNTLVASATRFGPHAAPGGAHHDRPDATPGQFGDLGVLVDLDAQLGGHPGQLVREPGRVQQRATVPVPAPPRKSGLLISARIGPGQEAGPAWPGRAGGSPPRGDQAGPFELAVQAEGGHVRLEPSRLAVPRRSSSADSSGQRLRPLVPAVGQAGLAEAAVAAGRGPADLLPLQQHHPGPGLRRLAGTAVRARVPPPTTVRSAAVRRSAARTAARGGPATRTPCARCRPARPRPAPGRGVELVDVRRVATPFSP